MNCTPNSAKLLHQPMEVENDIRVPARVDVYHGGTLNKQIRVEHTQPLPASLFLG
jgi:hypothetical protein